MIQNELSGGIPNFRFAYKSIRGTKFSNITKAEYPEIAGYDKMNFSH